MRHSVNSKQHRTRDLVPTKALEAPRIHTSAKFCTAAETVAGVRLGDAARVQVAIDPGGVIREIDGGRHQ
jgi:hypothetical protein